MKGETPKEKLQTAWEQEIPEAYKEGKYWEKFKGKPVSEVLKSYAEAQDYFGRSVSLPKSGEDAEGWSKIYKALGRPEDTKGYEWDPPEITGHNWEDNLLDGFKKKAWELGLNQTQAKGILDWNAAQLLVETRESTQAETEQREKPRRK